MIWTIFLSRICKGRAYIKKVVLNEGTVVYYVFPSFLTALNIVSRDELQGAFHAECDFYRKLDGQCLKSF